MFWIVSAARRWYNIFGNYMHHPSGWFFRSGVGSAGAVFYFPFLNTDFIIRITIDVKENPYNIPEIRRLMLFDLYVVVYCSPPSTIRGAINIAIQYLKVWNGAKIRAVICPIAMPVHLAHNGNWYPLKKKLRSGIWWQLQYFLHHSIEYSQSLSFFVIL